MTKVIKEEFEKLESLKISDDLFTCNISLEIFHNEFNRMGRMDDDLFTYEMTHGSNVDMEYDPSNVAITEWLASKFYNLKRMDQYTKNALWIYWTRGDDEVELTDEESSDSDDDCKDDEVVKIFRINTNVFDFETPTGESKSPVGSSRIPLSVHGFLSTH
nr:C2 calcium/lipid-binding domain, CaLB [Tanacetum cinerariifolium]